jgi:presenilin-like A22 family membrane protease
MPLRVIELRQYLQILTMFMLVQFAGLLLATQVFNGVAYEQVTSVQEVSTYSSNLIFYIAYIIILSIILLFVFKVYRGKRLFTVFEAVVVFIPAFYVFLICLSALSGSAYSALFNGTNGYAYVAALVLAALLIIAKNKMPGLRNVTALIASVGVGLILGILFGFEAAYAFMAILAVYDFIAVFITKHMVALADVAINNNLSLMVMVDEAKAVPLSSLSEKEKEEYMKEKHMLEKHAGLARELAKSNMVPVAARSALGTGDLAVPLMVAVAAYKINISFIPSLVVVAGSIVGVLLNMMVLSRYKRALPAIPLLLFGISAALAVYFLIIGVL